MHSSSIYSCISRIKCWLKKRVRIWKIKRQHHLVNFQEINGIIAHNWEMYHWKIRDQIIRMIGILQVDLKSYQKCGVRVHTSLRALNIRCHLKINIKMQWQLHLLNLMLLHNVWRKLIILQLICALLIAHYHLGPNFGHCFLLDHLPVRLKCPHRQLM